MHRYLIATLQAGILTAFLAGLFSQILVIPGAASGEVERHPPYAPFAAAYVTVAIIGVACIQVALIAMWALLTMVRRNEIFRPQAFRWFDTIIGSSIVATLLAIGVSGHVLLGDIPFPAGGMEDLSALATAVAGVGVGASIVILLFILRGLLRRAVDLESQVTGMVL
jgi:hypothetical protein